MDGGSELVRDDAVDQALRLLSTRFMFLAYACSRATCSLKPHDEPSAERTQGCFTSTPYVTVRR